MSTVTTDSSAAIIVWLGRHRITIAACTPRAVIAAARRAVDVLDVDDLRDLTAWADEQQEDIWLPGRTGPLSIVGILAMRLGARACGVDYPDDDDGDDFFARLWRQAPRTEATP